MLPLVLFLTFTLIPILDMGGEADPVDDPDPADPGVPDPTDPNSPISVATGDTIAGTDDDDVFDLTPNAGASIVASVAGGAGNDFLDFADPIALDLSTNPANVMESSTLDGGEGNDTITAAASFSTISGGAGDDVITNALANGSSVFGGDGNDSLVGFSSNGDSALIDGGLGDDTIDGRGMDNVALLGGEGNDVILMSGANQPGAGYVVSADGGLGDDTIRYEGTPIGVADQSILEAATMTGGDGADSFEIQFDATGDGLDETGDPNIPTPAQVTLPLVNIADFEPGTDVLTIEPLALNPGFTVSTAELTEDATQGTTTLTISYTNPDAADRDVVITMQAANVEWEDIVFIGSNVPELTPLGA